MSAGPKLTPVCAEDFEALAALRIAAMQESLTRIGRFDAARARARLLDRFAPDISSHIEVDNCRVGFMVLQTAGDDWLLDHLYIHPDFQGRGYGSAVMRQLLARADAAGKAVRLGALRGSAANRFYQSHGFVQIDEAEWDIYYRRAAAPGAA